MTLAVLKAWIEPMAADGALPNAKVRESVLRLLHQLPVDCSMEDRKEQLKRSGLGRVVMFLFKVPGGCLMLLSSQWCLVQDWGCSSMCMLSMPPHPPRPIAQTKRPQIAGWPRSWWSAGAAQFWRPIARVISTQRCAVMGCSG